MVLCNVFNKKWEVNSKLMACYFSFESINCGFKSVFELVLGGSSWCIYFSPRSPDSMAAIAAIIAAT